MTFVPCPSPPVSAEAYDVYEAIDQRFVPSWWLSVSLHLPGNLQFSGAAHAHRWNARSAGFKQYFLGEGRNGMVR